MKLKKSLFKNKKVYISGSITGLKKEVFEKNFKDAEDFLISEGFKPENIVNPCKIEHKPNSTWWEYMKRDIDVMLEQKCSFLFLMENSEKSFGASMEIIAAKKHRILIIRKKTFESYESAK